MPKILIFFQSSIEFGEIMKIIKQSKPNSCKIIVTGNKNLFLFFKKLRLEKKFGIEVYNFCALSLKNPLNFFLMFYKYHYSQNIKKLKKINFSKAYFFNEHEDFVAPIFLSKCNIKKIVRIMVYEGKNYKKYQKKMPLINQKKLNFFFKVKFFVYRLLQRDKNIKIILQKNKLYQLIYFHLKKKISYQIPSNHKMTFLKLKKKNYSPSVLYIDSNDEKIGGKKFILLTNQMLNQIESKGYNVIIKKHTNESLSKSLAGHKNREYLLDPIPIEIYDLSKIKIVVGLRSSAIATVGNNYPHIKCISTAKIILDSNKFDKISIELNLISKKKKIFFPKNISDIIKKI